MSARRLVLAVASVVLGLTAACTSPRLRRPLRPRYPEILRSAEVPGGRVVAHGWVDRRGQLTRVTVAPDRGTHALFAQAVTTALREARLRPARRVGLARGSAVALPVRFVLLAPGASPPASDAHTRWVGPVGLPSVCPAPSARGEVLVCVPAAWRAVIVVHD